MNGYPRTATEVARRYTDLPVDEALGRLARDFASAVAAADDRAADTIADVAIRVTAVRGRFEETAA